LGTTAYLSVFKGDTFFDPIDGNLTVNFFLTDTENSAKMLFSGNFKSGKTPPDVAVSSE
jgi:hypothetical protein